MNDGDGTQERDDDDLASLLAPPDVPLRPGRPPRPDERTSTVPSTVPAPDVPATDAAPVTASDDTSRVADDTRRVADEPVRTVVPRTSRRPAPPARTTSDRGPAQSRTRLLASPAAEPVAPLVLGRRFQPVAGGSLPRPSEGDGAVAHVLAPPGAWVHAILAGRVRRAPAQIASGALELHGDDGTVLVVTGPAQVAWTVDDDQRVGAGHVLGVVVGAAGDPPVDPLTILAFDAQGQQVDAVALLVGLPDPGELDLHGDDGTTGVDPYDLDLELAGGGVP
ncbi:hypothetical protein [Cellulomonas sp. URHD0024]|uniref:hypothetical protein n=1 Tax=Cellulomonas sp. URHD0024 TaxID=1302620 RepID=UPI0006853E61|nr:hypothetical protein [Cellulomonas sp. URHD0024]